ncbi:hypothetical protein C0J08_14885 [Marinomonas sp. CT5]|uniref:Arc family DNA-binding protein n=1 Tax=Marinomonas sp. CT5 TaxID=2066133 RepID=UPI001BB054E4|nr:Arc family DNA-binding protein [Marinomonas sp. CT5]QUX96604.1 hypothetical protein C0J08_14885 [Marinomonas sp. CT5]
MTKRNPQINVRLPEELKQMVHDRAEKNGRSVNSEIVEIIERAVFLGDSGAGLISAEHARKMSNAVRREAYSVFLGICIEQIKAAYESGDDTAIAEFHLIESEQAFDETVPKVKAKLEELGYTCDIDMGGLVINF